jgi:hypothetical protein
MAGTGLYSAWAMHPRPHATATHLLSKPRSKRPRLRSSIGTTRSHQARSPTSDLSMGGSRSLIRAGGVSLAPLRSAGPRATRKGAEPKVSSPIRVTPAQALFPHTRRDHADRPGLCVIDRHHAARYQQHHPRACQLETLRPVHVAPRAFKAPSQREELSLDEVKRIIVWLVLTCVPPGLPRLEIPSRRYLAAGAAPRASRPRVSRRR